MGARKKRSEMTLKKEDFFAAKLACCGDLIAMQKKLGWPQETIYKWNKDPEICQAWRAHLEQTHLPQLYLKAQRHALETLNAGAEGATTLSIFLLKGMYPDHLDEGVRRQRIASEATVKAAEIASIPRVKEETAEQWTARTSRERAERCG